MDKDFKNYKYHDCVKYASYMGRFYKKAFELFEEDKEGFRDYYRTIKNELKEDNKKTGLVANVNPIVTQYLSIREAYIELHEPTNSNEFNKMRGELLSSWSELTYYIKELKNNDIY